MYFKRTCGIHLESTDSNCREWVVVPDNDAAQRFLTVNAKIKQLIYLKIPSTFRNFLYVQPLM